MTDICVVCGWDQMEEPQWIKGVPSHEICSCCGFQAGFDDDAASHPQTVEQYRERWLHYGAQWFSAREKPANWNLNNQLKNINYNFNDKNDQ